MVGIESFYFSGEFADREKVKTISWSLLFTTMLVACSMKPTRAPNSVFSNSNRAQKIQQIDYSLAHIYAKHWQMDRDIEQMAGKDADNFVEANLLKKQKLTLEKEADDLKKIRQELELSLSAELATKEWTGMEPWQEMQTNPRTAEKTETLIVDDIKNFTIQNNVEPAFALEHKAFGRYQLQIKNNIPLDPNREGATPPLDARLECDGDILYGNSFLGFHFKKEERVYEFSWYNNNENAQNISVGFSPGVNKCEFLFKEKKDSAWTHKIHLVALDKLLPTAPSFNQHLEVCARPSGFEKNDPVSFFWQQDFKHVTCPRPFEKMQTLRDPIKAFNTKIRNLTGANVPESAFREKNPLVELDFSKAPNLSFIWVSSLNFSADFYGDVLSRALRFHADRGAQIRILIPEATAFPKDKRIINKLMVGRPNVKIQYYKYRYNNGHDGDWVDKFHRVNHVKLLIGYSDKEPKNNFFVTGGRNIRDSYLFKEKPQYAKYPWLTNYARNERPFIYYDDFEVELRGSEVVKSVLAQMLEFWNRDEETNLVRSTNVNVTRPLGPTQSEYFYRISKTHPMVRNLLSIPYSDGNQLEKFYVNMFDSAQKEILITTPYFRPSKAISEAFGRASKRGVKVKVLTRIKLAGDGVPTIAEDVNKEGVNRHLRELEVYEWMDPKSIMHAKLLVIDQQLSFISSVNLNGRSFTHDTESGVLILHEETARKFREEVLGYFKQSERITEAKKVKWLNGVLIDWFDSYF